MTRTRADRGAASVDAVVVLVAVVIGGLLVLVGTDVEDVPPVDQPRATPQDVPATGQYVRADITAGGELEVSHWVSTSTPVTSLRLRAGQADGQPGTMTLEDVEVTTGGATVATLVSVGRSTQQVALGLAVRDFVVTFRIDAPLDGAAATVDGRALAFVPALSIDYDDETGPVRRRVVAPGEILNVACVRADGAAPRPCGSATGDGWQVDLDGEDRDDGLLVQVQLSG